MKVLVIGGTGFIGPFVLQQLVAMGHQVTVFHRGKHEDDLPPQVAHIHSEDAGTKRPPVAAYAEQLRETEPDVVLHMIALIESDARELMETFRGVARRVVVISSQDVYRAYGILHGSESGEIEPMPLHEDSPLRTKLYPYRSDPERAEDDPDRWIDLYDKIPIEQIVMGDPALPGTIVRLPAVYGPRTYQYRLFPYVKRMVDGRPTIILSDEQARWVWAHGYVENVAHAIALAVNDDRAAGRIYNAGEPYAPSTAEWVRQIGSVFGWEGDVVTLPAARLPERMQAGANVAQDMRPDTTRIRAELGYSEIVPFEEGMRRSIEWERARSAEQIDAAEFDYEAEDELLRMREA